VEKSKKVHRRKMVGAVPTPTVAGGGRPPRCPPYRGGRGSPSRKGCLCGGDKKGRQTAPRWVLRKGPNLSIKGGRRTDLYVSLGRQERTTPSQGIAHRFRVVSTLSIKWGGNNQKLSAAPRPGQSSKGSNIKGFQGPKGGLVAGRERKTQPQTWSLSS